MNIFAGVFPNFGVIFGIMLSFFLNGGWVLVAWVLVYILYRMYRVETNEQFVHSIEWVFLL